ncbi:MAG: tagaturonate reductase [Clostridia bacterium]
MKRLNYKTLEEQNYSGYLMKTGTERMLQFGEGNFLRSFVDFFVDEMNEKSDFDCKVVVCQPINQGLADFVNEQDGLYTLYLRGAENGESVEKKKIISSISRCINPYNDFDEFLAVAKNPDLKFISSNTTEAGIAYDESVKFDDKPQNSFPGKLTRFMYERYKIFGGDKTKGFIILSCELIDNNGKELEKCVLKHATKWNLGQDFINWLTNANEFCSTLVDRIATGYPRNEADLINKGNSYEDKLIDTAEIFGLWVIEGNQKVKEAIPFEKANLPIIVTDDHSPYKQRKVGILNGAHTTMVMGAYLAGQTIVRDCMEDDVICGFVNKVMFDEVIPILSLDKSELKEFAGSVIDRFLNPFIDHELLSITLNSTSKWKARVLPSLLANVEKFNTLPKCITASFAFYIEFYRKAMTSSDYDINDDDYITNFYKENYNLKTEDLVHKICQNTDFWGTDLSKIDNFANEVTRYMKIIEENGTYHLMSELIK